MISTYGSEAEHAGSSSTDTTAPRRFLRFVRAGALAKLRRAVTVLVAATGIAAFAAAGSATAETRTLDLYYTHTKERLTITFKKDGRYIPGALAELNRFLRDWRRNESIKMDPRLFDVVWETYQRSGSRQPIHVVSAYRSLATNNALRSRSKGVAKHSQHTLGKAMDWYVPDVSINRLREIAMKLQQGGVGWYPTSRSPFVHTDVGSVRAWPRMTRQQLVKLFPDGKTVHLPADGKPLAGYQQALAELKRNGGKPPVSSVASASTSGGSKGGLLAMLFGDDEGEGADDEAYSTTGQSLTAGPSRSAAPSAKSVPTRPEPKAPAPAPAPVVVADIPLPVPAPKRPEPRSVEEPSAPVLALAPLPPTRPEPIAPAAEPVQLALAAVPPVRPEAPAPVAAARPDEPANAQLALAEVARDPAAEAVADPTLLGYANPVPGSAEALAGRKLAAVPPAAHGLITGQADPFTTMALPPIDKADATSELSFGSAAADLPVYDGGQSAYWGVFARFVHPDQRKLGELMQEPVRVLVAGFGERPYEELSSTSFQGAAVPTLRVQRFTPIDNLAMR